MRDLLQCTPARNDFRRWLKLGHAPLTIWQGEKAVTTLIRLGKKPSLDYLYQAAMGQDNSISWNRGLMFCGVYDIENQALYLTEDALIHLAADPVPLVINTNASMAEEISKKINQQVEDTIANDPNNLPGQEITGRQALRDLQYYQEYGAKGEAIKRFFHDDPPDSQFHSGYMLDELPEAAFLAYIQAPEIFVQTEAEQYIKTHREDFLLRFLKNDALLAEYQALVQDTGSPIQRMKAITDAVKASGAKTVTVTVQKEEQELTFKAAASALTGYKNSYSTYDIPASDRQKFKELFGRHSNYKAEDITRITYGRNTIYEAPTAQTEDLAEGFGMGGMHFG